MGGLSLGGVFFFFLSCLARCTYCVCAERFLISVPYRVSDVYSRCLSMVIYSLMTRGILPLLHVSKTPKVYLSSASSVSSASYRAANCSTSSSHPSPSHCNPPPPLSSSLSSHLSTPSSSARCRIVGLPCGQFHGLSSSPICRTIFSIALTGSARPTMTLFRQARMANMERTLEQRRCAVPEPRCWWIRWISSSRSGV